jgi:membrane complex biogenesis BtpA family protein
MRVPLPGPPRPLFGVVHLPPLPGSPGWVAAGRPPTRELVDHAVADARAFLAAGFDGLVVENYGDVPFFKECVPPETVAALTRCAAAVVDVCGDRPVGINVLRNDARAALAIAVAAGARFVRVNVHSGAAVTDQGLVEGRAADTLRLRDALGASRSVAIVADVHVKHARPLAQDETIEQAAKDAAERGLADGLVVSGAATGDAPDPDLARRVRAACPGVPLLLGSGLTPQNAAALARHLDGAIAASAAREQGKAGRPVDPARAKALVLAWRSAPRSVDS